MCKAIIIGPHAVLETTINTLYDLYAAHIIDFTQPDMFFKVGKPLPQGAAISEKLVKLRAIGRILKVEPISEIKKQSAKNVVENLDAKISALELNITHVDNARAKIADIVNELNTKIDAIKPFVDLKLNFELYEGYENIAVFVGTVEQPFEEELKKITEDYELVSGETSKNLYALFVHKRYENACRELLSTKKFKHLKLPVKHGKPDELFNSLNAKLNLYTLRLQKLEEELANLRKKHAAFILACEECLTADAEKSEAPLRFATTNNTFVIDCWLPLAKFKIVKQKLLSATNNRLYVGLQKVKHEDEEKTPTALTNPKSIKPFEDLVTLFSQPRYKEFDPTCLIAFVFPIFFGLMIGDFGYGILMVTFGYLFMTKLKKYEGWAAIGHYLFFGGIFAIAFGLFLFGDFFGLPFISAHNPGHTLDWSSILGFKIPLYPVIHKLETSGVVVLLLISIIAGTLHLGLGLIIGFFNEKVHSLRRAGAKIGWLLVLFAVVLLILKLAEHTSIGKFFWQYLFGVFKPSIAIAGLEIPYATLIALIAGIVILALTEGWLAILDLPKIVANLISYTRLAAIGVAKGAMAVAFNAVIIPMLISGNIGFAIAGWMLVVVLHLMVFILGCISAGIQALRLHYVEFFLKFFEGGGTPYKPFGKERRYTFTTPS
jgi:V/A-type H+-transporting ATPase subunit I